MGKILSPAKVIERVETLKGDRSNWEAHWQDIGDYILPRKNDIIMAQTSGNKRNFQIYDNTGMQSCELLAGALHGLLTNPSGMWFELTTGDRELDRNDNVRRWLQDTTLKMHNGMNNSNFQTEVHEMYLDITGFGTAPVLILEDDEVDFRFQSTYVKEVYIEENEKGAVDTVYRCFSWTPKQIISFFGADVIKKKAEEVWKMWEQGKVEKSEIIHAVYPRNDQMGDQSTNLQLPIVSQYVLVKNKSELKLGGFSEPAWVVPRWSKAAGESYGRSPGMTALPEVKTINKMTETMLRGAQKAIDPPLQAPDDGFVTAIRTAPASINYYRSGSNGKDRIEPIYNDTRIDFGFELVEAGRRRIRSSFYVDQLQLQDGPQMTATEVNKRDADQMRFLGPMVGRMEVEFLKPTVQRVFKIMERKKRFLPLPKELKGKPLEVRYSSFIAKLQRENEIGTIHKTIGAMAPLGQISPQIYDNLDPDKTARHILQVMSYPQDGIRDTDDRDKMREQRAQAEQEQREKEEQMRMAQMTQQAGPAAAQLMQAQQQQAEEAEEV